MPSKKAMQLARIVSDCIKPDSFEVGKAAQAIDAHTAEALADYKRVLEQCEAALHFYAEMRNHPREVVITTLIDKDCGAKAANALAAIAELKKG